jgi:hypothetical protein
MIPILRAGRPAVLTIAVVAAFAVAACGGTTATTPPDGGTPAPTLAPGATPEPTTAPEETPVAGVIPSFDLSGLVQNLEGVDSYRVSISVDGEEQYSGTVVTKPVLSRDVKLKGGGDDTHLVVIGDEAWLGQGDGPLAPAPASMASGMLAAFDPTLFVAAFATPGALTGADDLGTEDKNGVKAHHFRIDSNSFVGALASLPPGANIDIWVAEEGYLVAFETTGAAGGGINIQVSGVNDPANVVERPS